MWRQELEIGHPISHCVMKIQILPIVKVSQNVLIGKMEGKKEITSDCKNLLFLFFSLQFFFLRCIFLFVAIFVRCKIMALLIC